MSTPRSLRCLLVAADDGPSGTALAQSFAFAGFTFDRLDPGLDVASALQRARYDCVVLDLERTTAAAECALTALRSLHPALAVLVVTAEQDAARRIRFLDLGADDCITKPVDAAEVAARVRAQTRRVQRAEAPVSLVHGPLRLQTDRRSVTWHGAPVPLTNKEFWLLEILVRNKSQVHSRGQLEETLYGWDDETSSNAVEVYIHHLRRKFHRNLVRTIRGIGYQIGPEDGLTG